jgi:hypothetical protein
MKNSALIIGLLMVLGLSDLKGQETFHFGFQTSPTFSWMRTDDRKMEGVGVRGGMRVGAVGTYHFSDRYALAFGVGFGFNQGGGIQNGYSYGRFWPAADLIEPLEALPISAKLRYSINFVEVPIGLKMRSGSDGDKIRYYVEIPTINLGIVSRARGEVVGDNNLDPALAEAARDLNILEEVKPLSLAWGGGGGVEIDLNGGASLIVGLSYLQQFTDLTENSGSIGTSPSDLIPEDSIGNIRLLSVRLGILF